MKQSYEATTHTTGLNGTGVMLPIACSYSHRIPHLFIYLFTFPSTSESHRMEKTRNCARWLDSTVMPVLISHTVCKSSKNSSSLKKKKKSRTLFHYIHIYTCIHVCVCIQVYIHVCIYTHTWAHGLSFPIKIWRKKKISAYIAYIDFFWGFLDYSIMYVFLKINGSFYLC